MTTQTALNGVVTKRLEGKIEIITGGDQGIGRAIALRLAAEGADIAFSYRANRTSAEEVVKRITGSDAGDEVKRRAFAVQADLSDTTQVRNFIAAVFDYFRGADILVNNAGLERRAPFWEVSEQDYDLVLNVNLKGVFFTTQAVARRWMAGKNRARSSTSV